VNEEQAAKALGEFFADGFKPMSFIYNDVSMEGFWFHDIHGPKKKLSDGDIESLLYLLDIYVNGE